MSIQKVTNVKSKYYGQWRIRVQMRDNTGRVVSLPVQYVDGTKIEAQRRQSQIIGEFSNESTYYTEKKMLFIAAYQAYLTTEHRDGRWSEDTYKDHLYSLRIAKEYFAKIKLSQINENVMRRFARKFVKDRGLTVARGTVLSRRLEHYRSFFKELIGTIYSHNPVPTRAIDKWFNKSEIQAKQPKFVFKRQEIDALKNLIYQKLEGASTQNSVSLVGCLVALETGCRPQEIQVLQWSDMIKDGDHDEFNVFKLHDSWNEDLKQPNGHLKSRIQGEYRYTLPISNETVQVLNEFHDQQSKLLGRYKLHNDNDYMMLNLRDFKRASQGVVISQKSLNEMIKRLCKQLDIGTSRTISMYTCRHSVATLTSAMGMTPAFAASRLGHSVTEYERTYLHEPRDLKDSLMQQWLDKQLVTRL